MDVDNFSIEKEKINKTPDDYDSKGNLSENRPEQGGNFEKNREGLREIQDSKLSDIADQQKRKQESVAGNIISAGKERREREERIKAIEKILEEDLDEIYLAMPKDKRAIFRSEGERACLKINELIEKSALTLKKTVYLIRQWLSYIPKVNKFFLEQEAKIKADEIMNLNKAKI
jgi:hypothetical protein